MTTFLKKLRMNVLQKRNVGAYLAYATGEIILVVIGILLALQINTASEERKNDRIVRNALKQIRTDLKIDMKQADRNILFYMAKDSLIHEVMSQQIKKEDYKGATAYQLASIATSYTDMNISVEGFNNLMSLSDKVSIQYDSIIADLKEVYVDKKSTVDLMNKYMDVITNNRVEWLKYNTDWFSNFYFQENQFSEEQINYYLTDPQYKNVVTEYSFVGPGNHCSSILIFRASAFQVYQKLGKVLDLPVQDIYVVDDYPDYLGTFGSKEDTMQITTMEHQLIANIIDENGQEEVSIIPLSETEFSTDQGGFYRIQFDSLQKVKGLELRWGSQLYQYDKLPR